MLGCCKSVEGLMSGDTIIEELERKLERMAEYHETRCYRWMIVFSPAGSNRCEFERIYSKGTASFAGGKEDRDY